MFQSLLAREIQNRLKNFLTTGFEPSDPTHQGARQQVRSHRGFRWSAGHGLDVALLRVFQNPLAARDDERVFQARGRHQKALGGGGGRKPAFTAADHPEPYVGIEQVKRSLSHDGAGADRESVPFRLRPPIRPRGAPECRPRRSP